MSFSIKPCKPFSKTEPKKEPDSEFAYLFDEKDPNGNPTSACTHPHPAPKDPKQGNCIHPAGPNPDLH